MKKLRYYLTAGLICALLPAAVSQAGTHKQSQSPVFSVPASSISGAAQSQARSVAVMQAKSAKPSSDPVRTQKAAQVQPAASTAALTPEPDPALTPSPVVISVPEPVLTPAPALTPVPDPVFTPAPVLTPAPDPVLTPASGSAKVPDPTQTPTPRPTKVPDPTRTPTVTPKPSTKDTLPEKGTLLTDMYGNTYKVARKGVSLQFVSPSPLFPDFVVIPARTQIRGVSYKVTSIANGACDGNTRITSVSISSYVTSIGKNAFRGCKKLRILNIPSRVSKIGSKAFYNCIRLCRIRISGSSLTSVGSNAFYKAGSKAGREVIVSVEEANLKKYRKMLRNAKMDSSALFRPIV